MPEFAPCAVPAFSGKGTYIYSSEQVASKFHNEDAAAQAVLDMGCKHAWIRVHGWGYIGERHHADISKMKAFIKALKNREIAVAGWGWCQGENPTSEAKVTKQAIEEFGLDAFIADIEQGVSSSHWTAAEIVDYLGSVKDAVKSLAVTSHGFIDWHEPALLKAAQPFVDAMNPQAYWFGSYPLPKMLNAIGAKKGDYPIGSSAAYAKLCVDRYAHWYGKPVILTGQAYAEEAFTNPKVEARLDEFAEGFNSWGGIVGLNWWHFGAMTDAMRARIKSI